MVGHSCKNLAHESSRSDALNNFSRTCSVLGCKKFVASTNNRIQSCVLHTVVPFSPVCALARDRRARINSFTKFAACKSIMGVKLNNIFSQMCAMTMHDLGSVADQGSDCIEYFKDLVAYCECERLL